MKARLVRTVAASIAGLFAAGALAVVPAQAVDTNAGGTYTTNGPQMCC